MRITPANAPYALWLALRGPVAAWKVELPDWLARRFQRVRPYKVFTRDEWLLAHDRAFDLWKSQAFPLLSGRYRHVRAPDGEPVDFSRNVWQLLGMEFEALSLFASMLGKHGTAAGARPAIVEPRIGAAFSAQELETLFPGVVIVRSGMNRLLENAHEWLISLAHLAREAAFVLASLVARPKAIGRRAVAWLGISPQEIADRGDKLDFSWAARYGCVLASDVVYFLPQALNPAQRAHLDSSGIAYVEPADTYGLLPMRARLHAIALASGAFAAALLRPGVMAPLIARLMTRAPYWAAAFRELGTTTYVTTTSYSWPEKPELAIASARGIRSIIWAYSANSLTFTIASPGFRDVGVVRSIVIADEFWVWNAAYGEWLEKRRVHGRRETVRVVGPLMCGDPARLALDPAAARELLGLPREGLCIGVFDMPPISDAWRDRFGGGPPMVDTDTYVAFWKVIEQVVLRVPGSYALVKLKRDFTHTYREFPEFLRALLDENGEHMKAGRLRRVDVNVDPYLPVAACDIAIGIAYTSPVLAARTAGKPGYYLDPLSRANHPSHADYKAITLNTEDEVVTEVMRARESRGAPLAHAPAVTPPPPAAPFGSGGARPA